MGRPKTLPGYGKSTHAARELRAAVFIEGEIIPTPAGAVRPKTRGDCLEGGRSAQRPCPWAGCRYHLMVDLTRGGGLIRYAESPADMTHTCALDLADERGRTLEEVADLMGIVRERVRQIQAVAVEKMVEGLREWKA